MSSPCPSCHPAAQVCGAAGLACLDGWDDDTENSGDECNHHLIAGNQADGRANLGDAAHQSGEIDAAGAHQYGVGVRACLARGDPAPRRGGRRCGVARR